MLNKHLIYGARLDVCCSTVPGLMGALCRSNIVCLSQLVDAAGLALTDSRALSSVLGVRSVRPMQRSLELWKTRLTEREKVLLLKHSRGEAEPDPTDPYPEIHLCPGFTELSGPLLKHNDGKKTKPAQDRQKDSVHKLCKNYSQNVAV